MKNQNTLFILFMLLVWMRPLASPVHQHDQLALADTSQVHHAIELAYTFDENYEHDSCLYYATQAVHLARRFLQMEHNSFDTETRKSLRSLMARTYVVFALAIRAENMQAAEDSLLAGIQLFNDKEVNGDKADMYVGLGKVYDRKGQDDNSLRYFKMALEIYQQLGDQESYVDQLINLGIVLRVRGEYGESLEHLMEALHISREFMYEEAVVESLLAMGFVYAFVEKWDDALRCQQEALDIYTKNNNIYGIARIHNDMGVTLMWAGKLDSAMVQHKAALAIRLQTNDNFNIFASYLYIGDILAEQGDIHAAIQHYEKAMPFGYQADYKIMLVDAKLRLGECYAQLPDLEKALEQFENGLQLAIEIGDQTGETRATMGLANIYLIKNEPAKALGFLKRSEQTVNISNLNYKQIIYKDIAMAYATLGDYENAYNISLLHAAVRDSASAAENVAKITRLTNKLDFDKGVALQAEAHETMMAIKQAQINRERLSRNFYLSGMLLALVLGVVIFVRFIEKKRLSLRLNQSLVNLRETQTQLIQSEKMASLGELTAGIAHEIQNPLNFVNNFSEVSRELISEMNDELAVGTEASVRLAKEISADIEQNLEKINHHGKRADAIVKGMLQHSRSSTGQKEPTNINALADEYLRLSYHGLRAKNKSFNADFKTKFDPELPTIQVVPQDLGRVMLNLVNNAFYACTERKNTLPSENYKPTVIISTKNLGDKIEIAVNDNGSGIPDAIKEKIFQPFFTTKPTGQGTGLGLSLSYDIIKAHGGELQVESLTGEGTTFFITLPFQ